MLSIVLYGYLPINLTASLSYANSSKSDRYPDETDYRIINFFLHRDAHSSSPQPFYLFKPNTLPSLSLNLDNYWGEMSYSFVNRYRRMD